MDKIKVRLIEPVEREPEKINVKVKHVEQKPLKIKVVVESRESR